MKNLLDKNGYIESLIRSRISVDKAGEIIERLKGDEPAASDVSEAEKLWYERMALLKGKSSSAKG